MNRKIILLQYSNELIENALGILMLSDAIGNGQVVLGATDNKYRTAREIAKYREIAVSEKGNQEEIFDIYLGGIKLDKADSYIVLINEVHYAMYNKYFFRYLKENFDVKLVLIFRNMITNKKSPKVGAFSLDEIRSIFDLIVTDEPFDAEYYGLFYLPDPLVIPKVDKASSLSDCFFCGADKGRIGTVFQLYLECVKHDIDADLRIIDENKHRLPGITYTSWMTYNDIISTNMATECIVEILQAGQDGYSLRMQEAVLLNKKLLTNNPRVKESKYFETGNIQYFNKPQDIDYKWIKEHQVVDYGYSGEYSGIHFVNEILKLLNY